ncbi:hypothetical protein [Fulvimarina sp. MAC8]|uniref:hypothetical protein n=1 Tax=Fulvimarina sp. MAC8 TaxID=3162874 RepID=UPI0032EEBAAD
MRMSNVWIFVFFTVLVLIIAGLLIYILLFKLLFQPVVDIPVPNSTGTAREWIAATSGWFAGIVAIGSALITVAVLSQQISAASNQHLELMKFQAYEKIVLARQLQAGASQAHGTVAQLRDSLFNFDDELTNDKLDTFLSAAKLVSKIISDTNLTENANQLFGYRPAIGSFDSEIEEWIAAVQIVRAVPNNKEAEETRREMLARLSGSLIMLETDLKYISSEANDFLVRWKHLAT